ncbi:ras-related protein Rab-34-like [Homalodisca vitripennis]|uniref:ras-related protein Rab-34-like n=1 Tax=Homalodisca vitripennis TaxID=197043 RepID=UPI001EE9B9DA|nr:ras-related protein Rab-34-like [Homalodisca vitripennis]XP_046680651.1 ras-related protein Rab-34-like [Homalodisca vitripennis]XP_046680653.1 ras-related protein Rab-34-like [Homalodisca vitripennis]
MYETRSATYKMMMSKAPKSRQIQEMPPAFSPVTSPYELVELSPIKNPVLSCLRIAKAIFLGDVAVGKTCIINRFCHQAYDHNYKATIGVDFEVERFDIMSTPFNVQIWDTAGQERFQCIASSYYRGAHIVAVVFDLTSVHSLVSCGKWLKEALKVNPQSPLIFLVGNKMDLLSQASLAEMDRMASRTAARLEAEYWPVSALTGENVTEMFRRMAALAFSRLLCSEMNNRQQPISIGTIDISRKQSTKDSRKKSNCTNCNI